MDLKKKTYDITKPDGSTLSIAIAEAPCQAEGLVLTTWSSAGILSSLLPKLDIDRAQLARHRRRDDDDDDDEGYAVLELGAGTGLSGLAAAALWGTSALLTDLPTIVPGLRVNVDLNAATLAACGARAGCGSLDWTRPESIDVQQGATSVPVDAGHAFPVVLAADTMYTEDHPRLLTQTILRCLERSASARAVVVYAMRVAYIDYMREFWELMEEGGLVAESEGREEIDLTQWDDEKLHEWSVWKWKDL